MHKKNGKRKGSKNQKKNKVSFPLYGSINRPPKLAIGGNAVSMKPPRNEPIIRIFKLLIAASTTGTQTFETICLYLYRPMQYTRVVAGTITVTSSQSTSLTDAAAIFREFRVKKILVQFSNSIGTSTAFPPFYICMDSESSPFDMGATSTTSSLVNGYQNSSQFDPHVSASAGYWVPFPSSLNNQTDNIIGKGWLSTDAIGIGASNANDRGIIAFTFGNPVLGAPLTTVAGLLDISYELEFKLPD